MFTRPGVLIVQNFYRILFNVNSVKLNHGWVAPKGFDTGIKISNRKCGGKVPLIVPNKHFVKWYICGPTVYDVSHLGHASCYVKFDIINRILREFFDIKPVIALGITDIDDKIIIQSYKQKVPFKDVAKKYELQFFNNLNELNVLPPTFLLRVTEHIPEIIEFISKIIDKGDAYVAVEGSVYFRTPEDKIEPSHVEVKLKPGQKCHSDFALWKGAKDGEPFWESPWGKGRPGWHIECSAMASKVFGSQLDLHGGGMDLQFPHHANEEVQSCSYHSCKQWVNYWMYAGLLEIHEQKMSKSLNNFEPISSFLKTYTADNFRMFCFISKYHRALHYGEDSMGLPVATCNLISKFLADSSSYVKGNWHLGNISESELLQNLEETMRKVREHLADDFDTGQCHLTLMELIRKTVKSLNEPTDVSSSRCPAAVQVVSEYVHNVYKSFGFQLEATTSEMSKDGAVLDFVIDQVLEFRSLVRAEALKSQEKSIKQSLLNACDSLRSDFSGVGIVIKDQAKDKSSWSIQSPQEKSDRAAGILWKDQSLKDEDEEKKRLQFQTAELQF